ncbi:MAG: hypothetical protein KatS3mg082_2532 [Nitrospiraceae bacterium]|nr:MAG: hypothetical protein KatS3mg082_2532 [Nitrospiraceae bacterium]
MLFIAVGTPSRADGSADLSYVEEVGRGIAKNMNGYKVIATKSTVPVGTGEKLREVIKANLSGSYRFDIVVESGIPTRGLGHRRLLCGPTVW